MTLTLHGYRYSVYTRIARIAAIEKGLTLAEVEVDPFGPLPEGYDSLHPFGRVPVLDHDGFRLYETAAIARYLDEAFDGPALQPQDPRASARVAQTVGLTDAYAYWPLVRQAYSHGVFRPAAGALADAAILAEGLASAPRILAALETIAAEGLTLAAGLPPDLAQIHLAPMLAAFEQVAGASERLAEAPALSRWWATFRARPSVIRTDPGLPVL